MNDFFLETDQQSRISHLRTKLVAQYRSQAVRARAGPLCYLHLVYSTQPLPSFLNQLGRHLPRRVWVGALLASVAPVLFGLGPAALRQFF